MEKEKERIVSFEDAEYIDAIRADPLTGYDQVKSELDELEYARKKRQETKEEEEKQKAEQKAKAEFERKVDEEIAKRNNEANKGE